MLDAIFEAGDGARRQGQEVIIPLMKATKNPRTLVCIGTGFFISTFGLFATAAHVIRDVFNANEERHPDLLTVHFVPPDRFVLCYVAHAAFHLRADVAIGMVRKLSRKSSNGQVQSKALTLTSQIPRANEVVHTWAYPKAVHRDVDENHKSIEIVPKLYEGHILQEHRDGRDRVILPDACYETDLGIEGGASGGPVFDSNGRVFAINSTGFDGTSTAFISHIQRIGGLPVGPIKLADGALAETVRVSELIKMGHVIVRNG